MVVFLILLFHSHLLAGVLLHNEFLLYQLELFSNLYRKDRINV